MTKRAPVSPERKALLVLTKAVKHCINLIDDEMKLPPSPERGGRIAKITNALEMSNDIDGQAMSQLARRIPDACAALGIGKSTLYKLASEGKVRLIRIAGRTVVPESEIVRLASGAVLTGPQISTQKSAGLRRSKADILGR